MKYLRHLSKKNAHETVNLSYARLGEELRVTIIVYVRYVYKTGPWVLHNDFVTQLRLFS